MADYLPAINYVLPNEGGYSNDPADPGGATKFGILQRDWPEVDIASITVEQAIAWYQPNYWNKAPYSALTNQQVASKLFDMHVNCGLKTAVMVAQQALGFSVADVDGNFGPATLAAINAADPSSFLAQVIILLDQHYNHLVQLHSGLQKFLGGWIARAGRLPAPSRAASMPATA